MSALQQLLNRKNELDQKICEEQAAERVEALARIHALMDAHGLTAADLVLAKIGRTPRLLEVMYENRASGDTWSGRGKRPRWLHEALNAGHSLDEFRVHY